MKDVESGKSCITKCSTGIFRLPGKMFGWEPHQIQERRNFMKCKVGKISECIETKK